MPQLMFGGAVLGAWVDWNWKDNCGKTPFYLALFMGRLDCGDHGASETGLDPIDKKDFFKWSTSAQEKSPAITTMSLLQEKCCLQSSTSSSPVVQ